MGSNVHCLWIYEIYIERRVKGMFLLGIILGILIGMFLMACVSINNENKIENEQYNAELRALTHFRKLQEIERILRKATIEKEPAVFTVDKIKEVIVGQNK